MAKKKVYVYELRFRTYPGITRSILFRTLYSAVAHAIVCLKNDLWKEGVASKYQFLRYQFDECDSVVRPAYGVDVTDIVVRIARRYLNDKNFDYGQKQDSEDLERS